MWPVCRGSHYVSSPSLGIRGEPGMAHLQQRVILPPAPGALSFLNPEFGIQYMYASGYYKKLSEEVKSYTHSEELCAYIQKTDFHEFKYFPSEE